MKNQNLQEKKRQARSKKKYRRAVVLQSFYRLSRGSAPASPHFPALGHFSRCVRSRADWLHGLYAPRYPRCLLAGPILSLARVVISAKDVASRLVSSTWLGSTTPTNETQCDEKGPPCSNCISRELTCSYLRASSRPETRGDQTPAPLATVLPSPPQPLGIPSPAASTPPNVSGVRELELMHKYSTETYKSLCTSNSGHYVWQIAIPRMALQYDFLMNGILALGALHIAATLELPASLAYTDTAHQC